MKKVISAVLTAAMVVGMGVSVLAATPSKTVADEVKASGSATVTGVLGIVSDAKVTAKEDTAQVEEVLQDITSDADLQKAAGASKEKKTTIDVTVTQAFEMQTSNLLDAANVKLTIESKVIEAAYEDNEQVTVLVAVPKTRADGTVTYTYYTVPGKVVNGEIVVNLKGRQVKLYGSNFILVAVKHRGHKATVAAPQVESDFAGFPLFRDGKVQTGRVTLTAKLQCCHSVKCHRDHRSNPPFSCHALPDVHIVCGGLHGIAAAVDRIRARSIKLNIILASRMSSVTAITSALFTKSQRTLSGKYVSITTKGRPAYVC